MCNAKSMWPEVVVLRPLFSSFRERITPLPALHPLLVLQVNGKGPLEGWLREGGWFYLLASERCSRERLHVVSPVMGRVLVTHSLTHSLTDSLTQPGQQSQLLWQPSIHPRHSGASESTPVNIMHGLLRGSDILNSGHFSRSIHPGSAS